MSLLRMSLPKMSTTGKHPGKRYRDDEWAEEKDLQNKSEALNADVWIG